MAVSEDGENGTLAPPAVKKSLEYLDSLTKLVTLNQAIDMLGKRRFFLVYLILDELQLGFKWIPLCRCCTETIVVRNHVLVLFI